MSRHPSLARVGLLGGTFDPIHAGHLRMAREAERYCDLDRIYFAPAAQPWHRQPPLAGYADRFAMVALALGGRKNWLPLDIPAPAVPPAAGQMDQPRSSGRVYPPTYTVDQVGWLRRRCPGKRICFIVGADAFATLPTWKQYRKLLGQCDFAVLAREGTSWNAVLRVVPPAMIAGVQPSAAHRFAPVELRLTGGGRILWIPGFSSSASSTAARSQLGRAADQPRQRWTPSAVTAYARRAGLYVQSART